MRKQPDNVQILSMLGFIQARLGKFDSAQKCFEEAIRHEPDNPRLYNSLGDLFFTKKQFDDAIFYYKKAVQLEPGFALCHFNMGLVFQEKGMVNEAIAEYRKALDIDQNLFEAHYNLGVIFADKGQSDEAIRNYENALRINSDSAEAHYNLGNAYRAKGQFDGAIASYQGALQLKPGFDAALNNLGIAFQEKGRIEDAISCFKKVIDSNPDHVSAYNNLGNAFQDIGQYDDAIRCHQKAITLDPNLPDSYVSLGTAYKGKRQFDEAVASFQKAIQLNPNYAEAYFNTGNAYREDGRLGEAEVNYRQAIQLKPDFAKAYNGLGHVFYEKGRLDEAESYYRRAIQIDPANLVSYEANLFQMLCNPRYDAASIYSEHLKFAKHFAEPLSSSAPCHAKECIANRRLRIGYVSPDFRKHSVSYFVESVLSNHDRELFEMFCYSDARVPDEVTGRIQGYADRWRNLTGLYDEDAAGLIRKDGIDILVDLAGHTANNRILMFARKPAPVQVNWIGYPATTGLSSIDYKIVDNYTDPLGMTECFYTEKLIRMPENFLCYLPDPGSPEIADLPSRVTGHISFGSFSNFPKITPEVMQVWISILKAIPCSHLMLKAKSLSDEATREYVFDMFTLGGIERNRIRLFPWLPSTKEHLNLYNQIDIALDTFPYNGTTTTCEALWMGVPVITLAGSSHAGRVGASLLSNAGLSEFIADTADKYVEIAVGLAADMIRLESLRKGLRTKMQLSPLCDAKRFTSNLEELFREIWRKWCESP